MAVVKKWICDGCEAACETELDAETSEFYQMKITAGAWGKDVILCKDCNRKLLSQIDPTQWPRYASCAPRAA